MKKPIIYIFLLIGFTVYAQLETVLATYQYDNLNRLTQVVYDGGITIEYTYDNLGNRLERQIDQPDLTYVPDDNFEQKLIDLGLDDIMDDYVITGNISNLIIIDLTNLNIDEATGIEDFVSLETLLFGGNNLTEIDISSNLILKTLTISANQLSLLDLSSNTLLESLYCELNSLNGLNLTNNTSLKFLSCYNNNLSELDISNNLQLESIYCGDTNIGSLDLSNHVNLRQFESLNGHLSTLNVKNGNNDIITYFYTINNTNLFCIQVDDENAANSGSGVYANWDVDPQVTYSENCTLGIDDDTSNFDVIITPNPVSNTLSIVLPDNILSNTSLVKIYDTSGRLIIEEQFDMNGLEMNVPVSVLDNGTYLIQISNGDQKWAQLFIKK